jgi:hypothetical protein
VDPAIPADDLRVRALMGVVPTAGFVLAIPIALVNPTVAQLTWLLPFVGTRVVRVHLSRREQARTRDAVV